MDTQRIDKDVHLLRHRASGFPEGVLQAFQFIEQANPDFCRRSFYGLSRGTRDGGIDYWAAVEQKHKDEEKIKGLDLVTLPKGKYAFMEVKEFKKNITAIAAAFERLLTNPDLDPLSYCVERYHDDAVTCMVRLKD